MLQSLTIPADLTLLPRREALSEYAGVCQRASGGAKRHSSAQRRTCLSRSGRTVRG